MGKRPDISMTPREIDEFLRTKQRLVLGTLGPGGDPHADLAEYIRDGDALLVLASRREQSWANARRDPRVCCIVEQYPTYHEIRGVIVHGRATEETADLPPRLRGRLDAAPEQLVLRISVEHVVSFDFGKLRRA